MKLIDLIKVTVSTMLIGIVFLSGFSAQSVPTAKFVKGYVITSKFDTLHGEIGVFLVDKNSKVCHFRNAEIDQTFHPGEIAGYGLSTGKLYTSGLETDFFAEVLLSGKFSLYKLKGDIVFEKSGNIRFEIGMPRLKNGKEVENTKWKGLMKFHLNDCELINLDAVEKLERNDIEGIKKILIHYNLCHDSNYRPNKRVKNYQYVRQEVDNFVAASFMEGYIVNNDLDTILGKLRFYLTPRKYDVVQIKRGEEITEYQPWELKEYGFAKGGVFKSGIIDDKFLEILAEGPITLYKIKSDFYVVKSNMAPLLIEKRDPRDVWQDGQLGKREDNRWKGLLKTVVIDCGLDFVTEVDSIEFDEHEITQLVNKYNSQCNKE